MTNAKAAKPAGFFRLFGHVVSLAMRNMPVTFLVYVLISVVSGLSVAANTVFKQRFFDLVESSANGGSLSAAIWAGVAMGLFLVATLILRGAWALLDVNCFRKVQGYMGVNLNRKAARIDPASFEDNRVLDSVNKAYQGLEASGQVVSAALVMVLCQLSYFIFMGTYLFGVKPMLLVMMLLSFLPSVLGSVLRYRLFARAENLAAPHRRRYEYFGRCVYDREYAKETRLLGGFGFFYRLFRENLHAVTTLSWKTTKKAELTNIALRFVMLVGYTGMLVMLFYYLTRGEVSVGIFAAVLSSIDAMFDQMEEMLNYRLGDVTKNLGMAENYMAFLSLPERGGKDVGELPGRTVELKNVSFRYPGSKDHAVRNVSLTIADGETIAIVGENGAGKSTLVRLLTGLYLPDEGKVLLDGQDTREVSAASLYRGISAVFQKFQRYKMTLGENVEISDCGIDGDVETALTRADLAASDDSFPDGVDTMLGRDFGGVDLSGGQWQRLSIARGFYRGHSMIILDEPTAAIDPIEETRVYQKFADISRDKTAVIVTHRLGSAKIADRIVVMDGGGIVDIGTHDELMAREGKYQEMYTAQAKWYHSPHRS